MLVVTIIYILLLIKRCMAIIQLVYFIFEFLLHIDKYLDFIISNYGFFVYPILFLIIFFETGVVFTPFLPGDSLIFITGTFASRGIMNLWMLLVLFCLAAILGDSLNYWIGNYCGEFFCSRKFFKKEYLDKTKQFYEVHGAKTIVLARFVPIVRTFAPFVAGIGKMRYRTFLEYNIMGGVLWVSLFLFGGYFFGSIPWVEKNLTLVIYIIIITSVIPVLIEYFVGKKKLRKAVA